MNRFNKTGYKMLDAKVNYVLYWSHDEKMGPEKEIKIVLPVVRYG